MEDKKYWYYYGETAEYTIEHKKLLTVKQYNNYVKKYKYVIPYDTLEEYVSNNVQKVQALNNKYVYIYKDHAYIGEKQYKLILADLVKEIYIDIINYEVTDITTEVIRNDLDFHDSVTIVRDKDGKNY